MPFFFFFIFHFLARSTTKRAAVTGAISTHVKRRQLSGGKVAVPLPVPILGHRDDNAVPFAELKPGVPVESSAAPPSTPTRPTATPRRRRRQKRRSRVVDPNDVTCPDQLAVTLKGRQAQGFHQAKQAPRSRSRVYRGPLGSVNVNPVTSDRWVS